MNVAVQKMQSLTGHSAPVYALESGPAEGEFFSSAGDGMVVRWDMANPGQGHLVARLPHSVYAIHRPVDSNVLVCGHNYDGIHVLDWKEKKELRSIQLTKAAIFDIKSAGDRLFVSDGEGSVTAVDLVNWSIIARLHHSDKSARAMAINPETNELAVGYSDNKVRIVDLDSLALKYEWTAHGNSVFAVCYTPDMKSLVTGSRDARLKVWNAGSGYVEEREIVAHMYAINHVAFSPDGKHFVTCSLDKSIKVWETADFKLLKVIDKARHEGHGTSVNKLLWDGSERLISASDDKTISVWSVRFGH